MLRKGTLLLTAVLLTLLSTVGPAEAASVRQQILRDCADDGVLQGTYTPAQLRDARKHVKGDLAEYSDCADVLRRAELPINPGGDGGGGGGGGGSSSGVGGSVTPGVAGAPGAPSTGGGAGAAPLVPQTPEDQAALDDAAQAPQQPVRVAGSNLLAGAAPLRQGYRANGLPDSLIVALGLLALAGVALSLPPVRRRLLALRRRT